MKKLFILLALSSFTFGSAVASTVSNVNETVIADPCGDDGKCKKDKSCCKAKASATTTEVKIDAPAKPAEKPAGCSKSAAKTSCCSKKASASTATDVDQAPIAPEEK